MSKGRDDGGGGGGIHEAAGVCVWFVVLARGMAVIGGEGKAGCMDGFFHFEGIFYYY